MSPILAIASQEVNQFIALAFRAPGWERSMAANSTDAEAHTSGYTLWTYRTAMEPGRAADRQDKHWFFLDLWES